jgi:branched-chain amino acid transport system substrate-binding protein
MARVTAHYYPYSFFYRDPMGSVPGWTTASRDGHRRSIDGRRPGFAILVAAGLSVAGIVGACSTNDRAELSTPATSAPSTTTTSTTPPRPGDGELVIGVLIPSSGPLAPIGEPILAAVTRTVEQINAAGGVLGNAVTVIPADEGNSVSSALLAIDTLLQEGVDAIIGPLSSNVALGSLDRITSAGVLSCSPSATALALENFPDNNLFFRSIPSDGLLMTAIIRRASETGNTEVAIIHVDDPYGRALAKAAETELATARLNLRSVTGISVDEDDIERRIAAVLAGGPEIIVVLADGEIGGRILTTMGQLLRLDADTVVITNDPIRESRNSRMIAELSPQLRRNLIGVAHRTTVADNEALSAPFAAHAQDCTNLIALAATAAGSDQPLDIASQMVAVSREGGLPCTEFSECASRLREGLQIDFNGVSGPLALASRTGDPTSGRFETFTFGPGGQEIQGSVFSVNRS